MGIRELVAEALRKGWVQGAPFVVDESEGDGATHMSFDKYANALVPLVDRLCAEAAADALDAAAKLLIAADVPAWVGITLHDRADILRAGTKGDQA